MVKDVNSQYIGARYVPKFFTNPTDESNDWAENTAYEALTIVTYNNDSYTSKLPIPKEVGNPADNPQFWACTTKYTAALQALQSTVLTLEAFIGDAPLDTHAQILSEAVNELYNRILGTDNLDNAVKNALSNSRDYNVYNKVSKYEYRETLAGDSEGEYDIQGGAYNSKTNEQLVVLREVNTGVVKLARLDADDFYTVNYRNTIVAGVLGHANSATYNPKTNKYYIACADSEGALATANKVAVINPTTLLFEEYKQLSPITATEDTVNWHIAYDTDHDKYIARSNTKLQVYDNNFMLEKEFDISVPTVYGNLIGANELACGCYYNNHYVAMCWNRSVTNIRDSIVLLFYNLDDGSISDTFTINNDFMGAEPENMFVINDVLHIVYGQAIYNVKQVVPHGIASANQPNDLMGVFKELPAGTDLNDLLQCGLYMIQNSNRNNIGHAGYTDSESLVIVKPNAQYGYTQIQTVFDGGRFILVMRTFYHGEWSNWNECGDYYTPECRGANTIHVEHGILSGYFSGNQKEFHAFITLPKNPNLTDSTKWYLTGTFRVRLQNLKYLYFDNSEDIDFEDAGIVVTSSVSTTGIALVITKADESVWTDANGDTVDGNSLGILTSNFYLRYNNT